MRIFLKKIVRPKIFALRGAFVRRWWSSDKFYGKPSYVLACKLKSLKKDLKVRNVHEELKGLEAVEEEGTI